MNYRSHTSVCAPVTVVCGPPGSGKSSYVKERRAKGDLMWDFDEMKTALTGIAGHECGYEVVPFVLAMRSAFYAKAMDRGGLNISRIWIIESRTARSLQPEIEALRAQVISLTASKEECLERVKERGPQWTKIVEDWFARNAST